MLLLRSGLAIAVLATMFAAPATAQNKDGRFRMMPVDDGFARLDTETGAASLCAKKDSGWACEPMADSQKSLREEIDRLRKENAELKNEIKGMEEAFGFNNQDKGADQRHAGRPPAFKLPNEEDIDQAVDYLERMLKKFRDRFESFGKNNEPEKKISSPPGHDSTPL